MTERENAEIMTERVTPARSVRSSTSVRSHDYVDTGHPVQPPTTPNTGFNHTLTTESGHTPSHVPAHEHDRMYVFRVHS